MVRQFLRSTVLGAPVFATMRMSRYIVAAAVSIGVQPMEGNVASKANCRVSCRVDTGNKREGPDHLTVSLNITGETLSKAYLESVLP